VILRYYYQSVHLVFGGQKPSGRYGSSQLLDVEKSRLVTVSERIRYSRIFSFIRILGIDPLSTNQRSLAV